MIANGDKALRTRVLEAGHDSGGPAGLPVVDLRDLRGRGFRGFRQVRGTRALRELTDVVLGRAAFLDPADRAVLEEVLGRNARPRDVAALSGESARTVQRRVRRLTARLLDPEVVYILRRRLHWSAPVAAVAMALWVRGLPMRRAAADLGLSLHRVRRLAAVVRGLIEEAGPGAE